MIQYESTYYTLFSLEILTDCIAIFAEGKELSTKLYESVINEHNSDDTILPPNCTVHL